MSENDNALDDLMQFGKQQRKRQTGLLGGLDDGRQRKKKHAGPLQPGKGLNPLDLLSLPQEQRSLINWISRRKQASLDEILQADLGKDKKTLRATLHALQKEDYIHEALIDGVVYYRVVFKGKISRSGRGLPKHIWSRVELDNTVFLQENHLFQGLPKAFIQKIAHSLKERIYQRDDVILWQGAVNENIFFIKNGLVGIARLSPITEKPQILAYRSQGDVFGEFSLFSENTTSTATVTALTEATVLIMSHENFSEILRDHHTTAMEVMRVLIQRWQEMGNFAGNTPNLCAILSVGSQAKTTAVGMALSGALSRTMGTKAKGIVYTERPDQNNLAAMSPAGAPQGAIPHPDGFDVYLPSSGSGLSPMVRMGLLLDQLLDQYSDVIVGASDDMDETLANLLERSNQIILVASRKNWAETERLEDFLSKTLNLKKKLLIKVVDFNQDQSQQTRVPSTADYIIPYVEDGFDENNGRIPFNDLPHSLQKISQEIAQRIKQQNQLKFYVPTFVTLENNQTLETKQHLKELAAFLSPLFNDTVSFDDEMKEEDAQAMKSVYIINIRTSHAEMELHLPSIIKYVERLKETLNLELMALELNHNLVLV